MTGLLRPDVIGTNAEAYPLFRCPGCGKTGEIDEDQYLGRISIECEQSGCGYHDTQDWSNPRNWILAGE